MISNLLLPKSENTEHSVSSLTQVTLVFYCSSIWAPKRFLGFNFSFFHSPLSIFFYIYFIQSLQIHNTTLHTVKPTLSTFQKCLQPVRGRSARSTTKLPTATLKATRLPKRHSRKIPTIITPMTSPSVRFAPQKPQLHF